MRLFSHQGYAATGVKSILTDSQAPYGSLYHHFPGGKSDLGVAAIRAGGDVYRQLVVDYFDNDRPIADCVRAFFSGAADLLSATDFHDACPIATIAMETANTDDAMRIASADAFQSWIGVLAARLEADGHDPDRAHDLATHVFCSLEGAFVLARTTRSTDALRVAQKFLIDTLDADMTVPRHQRQRETTAASP